MEITVVKKDKYKNFEYAVILNKYEYKIIKQMQELKNVLNTKWHNGYVKLPINCSGTNYSNHNIDVHGGLTFSGKQPLLGFENCIGFDCNHYGDQEPNQFDEEHFGMKHSWKDAEFTENECKKIIDQLVEQGYEYA